MAEKVEQKKVPSEFNHIEILNNKGSFIATIELIKMMSHYTQSLSGGRKCERKKVRNKMEQRELRYSGGQRDIKDPADLLKEIEFERTTRDKLQGKTSVLDLLDPLPHSFILTPWSPT